MTARRRVPVETVRGATSGDWGGLARDLALDLLDAERELAEARGVCAEAYQMAGGPSDRHNHGEMA